MEAETSKAPLDELLYSRQIHALGRDAVHAIAVSSVVIIGMKGVGAETAKNVLLAGVKQLTVIDGGVVGPSDLSSQFLLREGDVGLDRAAVSATRLGELNENAHVQAVQGPLTSELLKSTKSKDGAHAVIATQGSWDELAALNALCRSNGTHFIAAGIHGLAAFVFVDLGERFEVKDATGEPAPTVMVESVTQDFPATVTVVEEQRHGFEDGDFASFSGIRGMTQLNDGPPRKVTVTGSHSFTIPDNTREYGRYVSGGYIKRIRPSKFLDFKPLKESIEAPTFVESGPSKMARPELLHAAFRALQAAQDGPGNDLALPLSYDLLDEIYDSAQSLLDRRASSDLATASGLPPKPAPIRTAPFDLPSESSVLLQTLAASWGQELAPMAGIVGGIVGQEVLKAVSGVMTPVKQWLYLDAFEAALDDVPAGMDAPVEARYAAQIGVFGQEVQNALSELRYLVAGAGGIGCELLKNFALMGVGSGNGGTVTVADADVIEFPNLPGQSLFRRSDLGKPKAAMAAGAVKLINPAVHTVAIQERLAAETEGVFNSAFFEKLSGVCTAVDDGASRLYIDARCVAFGKPMIDGGKSGTKGSVQVFVPHQSEMYASTRDPPEHREFQICTLKNFPYAREHTLQWALDIFEGLFRVRPADVNAYLSKRDFLDGLKKNAAARLPTLESLRSALVTQRPLGLDACIAWARNQFEELFTNSIKQLTFNFPPGMTTSAGAPFWSGTKRAPSPLAFDALDPLHLDFIVAAANLQASVYGLKGSRDRALFAEAVTRVEVPPFEPREGVKIAVSDEAARGLASAPGSALAISGGPSPDADAACERLLSEMPTPASLAGYRLTATEYQKDDTDLYHLDFVAAAANLRARNYGIPPIDKLTARLIAGRILPSIITSASVVAGLMCLELYKLVQNKPLDAFRHSYLNLAFPLLTSAQPLAAVKTEVQTSHGKPLVWTLWDRFEVDGRGVTLAQFLTDFKAREGLEVSMLSFGRSLLYAEFLPKKKMADRLSMTLVDLVKQVAKAKVLDTETRLSFSISCSDANDDDVEVPDVIVRI